MKNITMVVAISLVIAVFLSYNTGRINKGETINAIIGDISFVETFGYEPTAATNENLRIKTHLAYVEKLLRKKDVSNFTEEQQQKRNRALDLLHEYWMAGVFPRNYDYAERTPCFIDKDGRICAVGYLVEQTAGREVAEQINDSHKYEELLVMNDNAVNTWIETNGLTEEECAMIQPTYNPAPQPGYYNYNYISRSYGITSAVMGGASISLGTLNAIQINKGGGDKAIPILGLLTGAGQIVYASINFPVEESLGFHTQTNESQKALCFINIGIGTSTMLMSTWNLIANRKKKSATRTLGWNLYSFPARNNQVGLGFSLAKRF